MIWLIIGGILLLFIIVLVFWLVGQYNGLVRLREAVRTAWAQIDVQLKRRADLIPNLVETVKGYASHEKETLERVISARNAAVAAGGDVKARESAENQLTGALRQLFAVAEAYPDLKANQNFAQLQGELTNTENRISADRQGYNNTVQQFNTKMLSFPTNIVAGVFGFKEQPFFEVTDAETREAPKVSFA